jgi:hypothetical protein
MELPMEVLVHNSIMGMKGQPATLLIVGKEGYYELNVAFGEKIHRALLPVRDTVLISKDPEDEIPEELEIER